MNLTYLKYALEVERTGSITKAAQQLFMAQPNLSKAIKELEESIGVTIFERTSKGVFVTKEGKMFLSQAKHLIDQINQMEEQYRPIVRPKWYMNISVPRASYITYALAQWTKSLEQDEGVEINFKETNTLETIRSILEGDNQIGIIRYPVDYEKYFRQLIEGKTVEMKTILEFESIVLMAENHSLANKACMMQKDLMPYIQLVEGDLNYPDVLGEVQIKREKDFIHKHIRLYERGSQFELLSQVPTTYMYSCPIPEAVLEQYHLVQRRCSDHIKRYKDVLIYSKQHHFTIIEESFIKEILGITKRLKYI